VLNKSKNISCAILALMLIFPMIEFASANPSSYYFIGPATITLQSPLADHIYNQSGVPLSAQVQMPSRIVYRNEWEELAWLKYSIDGKQDVEVPVKKEAVNSNSLGAEANRYGTVAGMLLGISFGPHKLYIHGATRLTNHSETLNFFNATAYFVVENVIPTIQLISPEPKTYKSPSVSLEYKSDEFLSWTGYSIDQSPIVTSQSNLTLSNLFNGNHSLRIYGEDTSGNICASKPITFIVNTKKPPIININFDATADLRRRGASNFDNGTYFSVIFNVSQPTSWTGYSIDGSAKREFNGVIKTAFGTHTIMVYAKDLCGNSGVSDPFTVFLSSNRTRTDSIFVPNNTSKLPSTNQNNTLVIIIVVLAALIPFFVAICIFLVKHSRRKKERSLEL